MTLGALASQWSLDGSAGVAFLVLCAAAAGVYASAAAIGSALWTASTISPPGGRQRRLKRSAGVSALSSAPART